MALLPAAPRKWMGATLGLQSSPPSAKHHRHFHPLLPAGGAPIYAPRAVRFRLGGLACFAPDGARLSPLQLAEPARQDLQAFGAQQQAPGPAGDGEAAEQAGQQAQQAGGARQAQQQQQQLDWVWQSDVYPVVSQDELQARVADIGVCWCSVVAHIAPVCRVPLPSCWPSLCTPNTSPTYPCIPPNHALAHLAAPTCHSAGI